MIKTLSYIGMTRTLNLNSYSIFVVKTVLHWSNDWKKESVLHFLWNLKWYVKRYDLFYSPWCCAGGYQKFWLSQYNGRWIFRCFNKEQVVFCVRWLDEDLIFHDDFINFYEMEKTDATSMVAVIKDIILRRGLDVEKLLG